MINFDWILERPGLLRRAWPLCDIVNRFKLKSMNSIASCCWSGSPRREWVVFEFGISVANLSRAHGGCLGVRRRRAWKSAKSLGKLTHK